MIPIVPADKIIFSMSAKHPPVLRVADGTRLRFETCDCFTNQIHSHDSVLDDIDWTRINPATGPVFVEGAQAGDTLAVEIHTIVPADHAVLATVPGFGVAGEQLQKSRVDIVPVADNRAILFDKIRIPLNPMIGVIGTAPAEGEIPCGTPDEHGGNMDTTIITTGTTLLLPVNVDGALLAMGDLHAAMGDGEVGISGLEMSATVEVSVRVIKGRPYPLPFAVNKTHTYTIASHPDLDTAAEIATLMSTNILTRYSELDINQAIALQSIVGQLQISQVVDPNKTCRFALPREVLAQLGIDLHQLS